MATPCPGAPARQHLRANRGAPAPHNACARQPRRPHAPPSHYAPFRKGRTALHFPPLPPCTSQTPPFWLRGKCSSQNGGVCEDKRALPPTSNLRDQALCRFLCVAGGSAPRKPLLFGLRIKELVKKRGFARPNGRDRPNQAVALLKEQPRETDSYRTVPQLLRADLSTQLAASFQRRPQHPVLPPQLIAAPQRKPAARHSASCFARKSLHRILN